MTLLATAQAAAQPICPDCEHPSRENGLCNACRADRSIRDHVPDQEEGE